MHRRFDHNILLALITSVCMVLALAAPIWANEQSTATIEVRVSQGDDDDDDSGPGDPPEVEKFKVNIDAKRVTVEAWRQQ